MTPDRNPTPLLLATAVLVACACSPRTSPPELPGSDASAPRGEPIGGFCRSPSNCESGICLDVGRDFVRRCSARCETDAECGAEMTCGIGPAGTKMCVPRVCGEESDFFSYVCVDGESVACEQVDRNEHCAVCGCADSSLRCSNRECVPLSDVGGPCQRDSDCLTNNCSSSEFVCRVPVGSRCDATNCDRCLVDEELDYRFCTRFCRNDDECNGMQCIGSESRGFTCRPDCEGCPTRCSPLSEGGLFCGCLGCTELYPTNRALYSLCGASDSVCASGACLANEICTASCSADAECGELGRCVSIPCAEGETVACGNVCVQQCERDLDCRAGECVELPSASGAGAVSVCDPRKPDGHQCFRDRECRSGRCRFGSACIPADGVENGESCAEASECRSGSCIGGTCRGSSLIGQPCEATPDCAAGMCCAGSCRVSC